jgi:hexosaminidase
LDETDPDTASGLYQKPILLHHSCSISARAFKDSRGSEQVYSAKYTFHAGINKQITTAYPFSSKFPGGNNVLLDGVQGTKEYGDGCWQGYEGVDFDATIDLGDTISVENISAGFLQNTGSWIFLPTQVAYSFSNDGVNYTLPITVKTIDSQINMASEPFLFEYRWKDADAERWGGNPQARFVRIVAKNIGVCPKWHPGRGGKAWLFLDEIIINRQ